MSNDKTIKKPIMKSYVYGAFLVLIFTLSNLNAYCQEFEGKIISDTLRFIRSKDFSFVYEAISSNSIIEKDINIRIKVNDAEKGRGKDAGNVTKSQDNERNLQLIDSLVKAKKIKYYQVELMTDFINLHGKQPKKLTSR